jgi:outer membrane protein TolC
MKKILSFAILVATFTTIGYSQPGTASYLIHSALEKSNPVAIQKKKAAGARLDRQKAYLTYAPNIFLDATYTHLNDEIGFNVPPIQIPIGPGQFLEKTLDPIVLQKQNTFKTNINGTMILFSGMKVPLMASAAQHKHNAELNMVNREEAIVIKETMDYHDKLALINQWLVVLMESKKRLEKQAEFANRAFQNQLISAYDLSKIKIAQQELKAKEIELIGQKRVVIAKLNQLTGVSTDILEAISPELTPWKVPLSQTNADNRPEIKALEEGTLASKFVTRSETSDYLPKVFLFGKKELYEKDLSALDPPWYVGIGLKWHLFDGMQNKVDIQKARLETEILQRKTDEAKSLYNLNLQVTMEQLSVNTELIVVAKEKANHATDALNISLREYEVGLKSITERLTSESDYQVAQLDLIKAIYNHRQTYINLLEATGTLNLESVLKLTEGN